MWWGGVGEKSTAVIGWMKDEGSLVVLKEAQYLDSGVDEGLRLVGTRRACAGKMGLKGPSPVLAMAAAAAAASDFEREVEADDFYNNNN